MLDVEGAANANAQPAEVRIFGNKLWKALKTGLPEHVPVNCTYCTLKLINDAATNWAFGYIWIDGAYWKRVNKKQAGKVLAGLAELFDEMPRRPGCI